MIINILSLDISITCTGITYIMYDIKKEKVLKFIPTFIGTDIKQKILKNIDFDYYYIENKEKLLETRIKFIKDSFEKFLNTIINNDMFFVFAEDYAFNAIGKITSLAELNGVLKNLLYEKYNLVINGIAPTSIKKFIYKGDLTKEGIYKIFINSDQFIKNDFIKKFIEIYKNKIKNSFDLTMNNYESPLNDMLDSFFLSLFGLNFVKEKLNV